MRLLLLFLWSLALDQGEAFTSSKTKTSGTTALFSSIDRRHLLQTSIPVSFGIAAIFAEGQPAFAAASQPTPEELERIKKGYNQIQYLLANFEKETTICRENGGECKRDAEAVRKGKASNSIGSAWSAFL